MGRGKRTATTARAGLALSDGDGRSRLRPAVSLVAPEQPEPRAAGRRSSSPAQSARLRKQEKPELYCSERSCLWLTGGGLCPNHGGVWSKERELLARKRSLASATPEELIRLDELAALRP